MSRKDQKENRLRSASWIIALLVPIACGTLAGNLDGDATQANLSVKALESSGSQSSSSGSDSSSSSAIEEGDLTLTSGKACIDEIRIELPEGMTCEDEFFQSNPNVECYRDDDHEDYEVDYEEEVEYEAVLAGPFLFDLISGTSTPSLAGIVLPSGYYEEIELRFDDTCDLGEEVTIQLQGSVKDGDDVSHEFDFALDFDDEIEVPSVQKLDILEDEANEILVNLVVDEWFERVDFVECIESGDLTPNENGIIRLDDVEGGEGACEDIYEDILDSLDDICEFEDDDEDDDEDDNDDDDKDENEDDDEDDNDDDENEDEE